MYPLAAGEELQKLVESYRLILISLDASAAVRFKRAKNKYEIKNLETFIQVDHEF